MDITDDMVERGAQALWRQEGDEHTLLEFEAMVGHTKATDPFRKLARRVLQAALWGPADESVEVRARSLFDADPSNGFGDFSRAWEGVQKTYLRMAQDQLDEQAKDL
jgi:hypothetical protein